HSFCFCLVLDKSENQKKLEDFFKCESHLLIYEQATIEEVLQSASKHIFRGCCVSRFSRRGGMVMKQQYTVYNPLAPIPIDFANQFHFTRFIDSVYNNNSHTG